MTQDDCSNFWLAGLDRRTQRDLLIAIAHTTIALRLVPTVIYFFRVAENRTVYAQYRVEAYVECWIEPTNSNYQINETTK